MLSRAGKLDLPLELWIEIMLMLLKRDLPRLRIVNRMFCNIITPAIFRSISILMNDRSINRFLDLLDNPDLVGHVQEIEFEEGTFPGMAHVVLFSRQCSQFHYISSSRTL
jgi:hypothetical protein